jgi:uncharacterized membrane protein
MDEKLKRRIVMFNLAGIINLVLGLYVLIQGQGFLEPSKIMTLSLFFFAFAALDFYFPYAMKKKWRQEQAKAMGRGGPDATR